jgi:hypothetical protein
MSLIPQFHSVPAQADRRQSRDASRGNAGDCLPRRSGVEEGRSRRLKMPWHRSGFCSQPCTTYGLQGQSSLRKKAFFFAK